jgi:hypothetical protein
MKKICWILMMAFLMVPSVVLAAGGGPGTKFQEMVQSEVGPLFMALVALIAVLFIIKRQFTKLIGFMVFAMLVAVLVYQPMKVKDMGLSLFDKLFSGWM